MAERWESSQGIVGCGGCLGDPETASSEYESSLTDTPLPPPPGSQTVFSHEIDK